MTDGVKSAKYSAKMVYFCLFSWKGFSLQTKTNYKETLRHDIKLVLRQLVIL